MLDCTLIFVLLFEILSSFVCFAILSLCLLFGLSEDDAYVDKLPTFERHFDSFTGKVKLQRSTWGGIWNAIGVDIKSITYPLINNNVLPLQ